jgi:hypothetical protein
MGRVSEGLAGSNGDIKAMAQGDVARAMKPSMSTLQSSGGGDGSDKKMLDAVVAAVDAFESSPFLHGGNHEAARVV